VAASNVPGYTVHAYSIKLELHDADTDTDIFADFLGTILARKQRVSDVKSLAVFGESVSVSAPWNASITNGNDWRTIAVISTRKPTPAVHFITLRP